MKILKVKIKREKTPNKTHYTYPPEYDAKKIQVLCYESMGDIEAVKARGNTDEYCIGCVRDADAPQFLANSDITEISKDDAIALGNVWRKQVNKITDKKKVIEILDKVLKKQALTQKDEDAIDPDKLSPGLKKSRSFADLLDEYAAKF